MGLREGVHGISQGERKDKHARRTRDGCKSPNRKCHGIGQWFSTCGLPTPWQTSVFKTIYIMIRNSSKIIALKQQQNNFMAVNHHTKRKCQKAATFERLTTVGLGEERNGTHEGINNFATVMNCSVNICVFRWSQVTPVRGSLSAKGVMA